MQIGNRSRYISGRRYQKEDVPGIHIVVTQHPFPKRFLADFINAKAAINAAPAPAGSVANFIGTHRKAFRETDLAGLRVVPHHF